MNAFGKLCCMLVCLWKQELAEAEFIPATPDASDENKEPTLASEPVSINASIYYYFSDAENKIDWSGFRKCQRISF